MKDPLKLLSEEQIAQIKAWSEEDDVRLADVQSRIKTEFGLSLTYMESQFLASDLQLNFDGAKKKSAVDLGNPEQLAEAKKAIRKEKQDAGEEVEEEEEEQLPGGVSISFDQVARPGCMVSGKVVFSDGERAEWMIDQMGRFGLDPVTEGYNPSEEDLMEFQTELRTLLQSQGF